MEIVAHDVMDIMNSIDENKPFRIENMRTLSIPYCNLGKNVSFLVRALENNISLTSLTLDSNKLGDEEITILAKGLYNRNSLNSLRLHHNYFGDEGAKSLAESLKILPNLQILDICYNNIGKEGIKAILDLVLVNPTIHTVHVQVNCKPEKKDDISKKATKIKISHQPYVLNLQNNFLGDEFLIANMECLVSNKNRFTKLKLGGNSMGIPSLTKLIEGLKKNTNIGAVDICYNKIGDEGASMIVDLLKSNRNVYSLNLAYNDISSDGAIDIAEVIKTNDTLERLNLKGNLIESKLVTNFLQAIKTNTTIHTIILEENKMSKTQISMILGAAAQNKDIPMKWELQRNLWLGNQKSPPNTSPLQKLPAPLLQHLIKNFCKQKERDQKELVEPKKQSTNKIQNTTTSPSLKSTSLAPKLSPRRSENTPPSDDGCMLDDQ